MSCLLTMAALFIATIGNAQTTTATGSASQVFKEVVKRAEANNVSAINALYQDNLNTKATDLVCLLTNSAEKKAPSKEVNPLRHEITKKLQIQEKVQLDLFVMSQCPFSVMAETTIIPLLQEFGARVELRLNFIAMEEKRGKEVVFNSLHGQSEVDENIRQLVVARDYPEKLFAYLTSRAENYSEDKWQQTAVKAGIDVQALAVASRSTESREIFRQNIKRADTAGIYASPSLLIDGTKFNGQLIDPMDNIATQCQTGADPFTGATYTVCQADATSAWISSVSGGNYHALYICNSLGYATLGSFGGTCGSVCGFCTVGTSCSSPESPSTTFDGAGNCGSDANGPILCSSVQWQCVGAFCTAPEATATPASQTICSGSDITPIVLTSSLSGTTYDWTRDNIVVTGIPDNGTASTISGTLTNPTNLPITVTFTITPTAVDCTGTPITATILVNPSLDVNQPVNQVVCNDAPTAAVNFTGSDPGNTYNWTNNNPSIGLAASGMGNIPSFTATNINSTVPVVATVTVTPTNESSNGGMVTQTFYYTGAAQTFTVPAGVSMLTVDVLGAHGFGPADRGMGGRVQAVIPVIPGEVLQINVGGQGTDANGGFNGGGAPGTNNGYGGGGGASDIRQGGTGLSNRIVVAGGGGGTGSNCGNLTAPGGHGGGLIGQSGCLFSCSSCQYTGAGGTQSAGGIAGPTGHGSCGSNTNGSLGLGGSNIGGGYGTGGGGGYYGGGSGCFEGAGGGSSFTIPDATNVVHTQGFNSADGIITLSYNVGVDCSGPPKSFTITVNPTPVGSALPQTICSGGTSSVAISSTTPAEGTSYTWTAAIQTAPTGGTITGFINCAASCGASIAQTLINTGTTLGVVRYTVTPFYTNAGQTCAGAAFTVDVTVTSIVTGSTMIAGVSCFGGSNGAINLTASGGTPGYTYNWGSGITTEDRTGLATGTYTVTITDANGCTANTSAMVNQPSVLTTNATMTNISCFGGSNGTIDLTVGGGTPGYTYLWTNGQTIQDLSGLGVGAYTVTVTDANGCTKTTSAIVSQSTAMTLTTTTIATCVGGNIGSIDLMVSGGNPTYSYLWSNTSTTQDINGLGVGNYTVTVTDMSNCTASTSASITTLYLPCGWSAEPNGVGCNAGSSVAFNNSTQRFIVTSTNCYYANSYMSDALAFAQYDHCGNGSITVQVTGITPLGHGWAGVTMRESNTAGAKKVQLMTNLSELSRREFRTTTNGTAYPQQFPSQNRYWLRITRTGNQFVMYISPNGITWYSAGAQTILMGNCIEMGLVVTNYVPNSTVTATFANVTVTGGSITRPDNYNSQEDILTVNDFSIVPNPTNGLITLDLRSYHKRQVQMDIFNLQGKLLLSTEIETNRGKEEFDLSTLTNGMYLIRVRAKGMPDVTKRVVLNSNE